MTETLFSSREDAELLELLWPGLDSWPQVWSRLFEVLAALEQEPALGSLQGELEVDLGPIEQPEVESWPVTTDVSGIASLRERLAAHSHDVQPFGLVLPCQPVVVLPDARLTVLAYDTEDLVDLGEVPLAPVDTDHWRIVGGAQRFRGEALLSLRFGFDVSPYGNHLVIYVCSQYDLWRPERFDGATNEVGGPNAELLRGWFDRLAGATGAEMRPMALLG